MDLPTITIQTVLSREGLLTLRDAIDALLADANGDTTNLAGKAANSNADRKVDEVWGRVGDNAKRFLAIAARRTTEGGEFSMDDVAQWLDEEPKTVRSWHRNLGRTLKHVDAAIPQPLLMESRWTGERNVYRLPVAVREAILRRDTPSAPRPDLE